MPDTAQRYRRPSLARHPRVLWRRFLNSWPLLLWGLAILAVLYFHHNSSHLTGLQGAVETISEPVAPLETARLKSLNVTIGQRVKAGDPVAAMDTLLFDADTAVDEAQLIEVEGTLQDYQQRILEFVRDFESERSQAQFDLETQLLNQKRDASVLGVLQAELKRLEDLKQKGLINEAELAALRPEIAALEQTLAAYPDMIDIHRRRLTDATDDEDTMRKLVSDETQDDNVRFDILATIKGLRQATDEIIATTRRQREVLRASYTLSATRDGVVSEVYHQPGDVVQAGMPIVRLVNEHPGRIVGFLPEIHLGQLNIGDTVWVWRQVDLGGHRTATVLSIAPEIDTLPARITPIQGTPLRGRRIILECPDGHDLLPGETVRLQVPPRGIAGFIETLWPF